MLPCLSLWAFGPPIVMKNRAIMRQPNGRGASVGQGHALLAINHARTRGRAWPCPTLAPRNMTLETAGSSTVFGLAANWAGGVGAHTRLPAENLTPGSRG